MIVIWFRSLLCVAFGWHNWLDIEVPGGTNGEICEWCSAMRGQQEYRPVRYWQ